MKKDYLKIALNRTKRIMGRNRPRNPTFKVPYREDEVTARMELETRRLYYKYISNPRAAINTASKRLLKETTDAYTPYTKGRLKTSTAKELSLLGKYKNFDFAKATTEQIAKLNVLLTDYEIKNKVKGASLDKARLELLRTQLLSAETVSPEMKEYIRKSDLLTVEEYQKFINAARKRTGIYSGVDYDQLASEYYEEIAKSKMNTSSKELMNFIKFQMESNDIERANKIFNRAKKLKYGNKYVFTAEELAEYT